MRDPRPVSAPSIRNHVLVSSAIGVAALATFLAGRLAVSVFVAVLLLVAYTDLRGLLAERGHLSTFALGAGGVGAFLWCGYTGELDMLPAAAAGLVLALLVTRIALNEAGVQATGIVGDLSATLGAAGVVGVLGAHVLLVRAVPRVGFRGLLVLGLMVIGNDVAAFFVGRWRGRTPLNKLVSPTKTWEGASAGFGVSVLVGLIAGLAIDPPFTIASGLAFGAGVGVLAPLGDLVFSTIKRSAGVKQSGTYLGTAGGVLDVVDGLLFTAPAFYWAFRTIAL
jgi:phosphatidate cytidylyltransferase